MFDVEVSDDFRNWYEPLSAAEQNSIDRAVGMLAEAGLTLGFPLSSAVASRRVGHLRELRVQHAGRPFRILYAFDPARNAFLILGGDKGSEGNRWYEMMVPRAEKIYLSYIESLRLDKTNS